MESCCRTTVSEAEDNNTQRFDRPLECEHTGDNFLSTRLVCCIETARTMNPFASKSTSRNFVHGTSRVFTGRET